MEQTINYRIKQLRLHYQKTQDEVANQLGLSQAFYSGVESGTRKVSLKWMTKLLKAYPSEVSAQWLLNGEGSMRVEGTVQSNSTSQVFGLRDLFAKDFMCEWIRMYGEKMIAKETQTIKYLAMESYRIADAMLEEREVNRLLKSSK